MNQAFARLPVILALAAALAVGPAAAQDGDEARSADEAQGEVQLGAGSTSSVTQGSSAAEQSEPDLRQPIDVAMPYPDETGPFRQTGQLAIATPSLLRCEVIADPGAQSRCQRRQAGGTPADFGGGSIAPAAAPAAPDADGAPDADAARRERLP